jgi:hypothetical protein
MKFYKDANTSSTILVVLFSADNETTGTLDNFVKQIQKGLDDSVSDDPPNITCLYRRGTEEALQYKLTKSGNPLPGPTAVRHIGSMKEQLESFFKSEELRNALETKGRVYLIIGAHGSPNSNGLGISIIGKLLKELFLSMSPRRSQRSMRMARAHDLWRRMMRPSLPSGMAIQSSNGAQGNGLTITELNQALMQLYRSPDTMVLHSCNLSTIESLFEMQHIEHHVACETSLKSYMCVSEWFSSLEKGLPPQPFTEDLFNRMRCQNQPGGRAEGIFSSHKSNGVNALVELLNRLGRDLNSKLIEGNQETIGKVALARSLSNAESWDLVDLSKFSELCAENLGSPFTQSSLDIKQVISTIQYGLKITPSYSFMSGHGGICVFFPVRESGVDVKDLPSNFRIAAADWIRFLDNWVI